MFMITRKRATAAAALAVLAGVLAACGSSSASGSGSSDKTLTVAWAENPAPLNPAVSSQQDVGPIDANIFDTRTWLTPEGKTYTFTLRSGVKFQDGTPFNAQAVVANIKYVTAKATASTVAIGLLGPCVTATAVSQYVVALSCWTPFAPLPTQLSEPFLGIQPPAALTKYGPNLGNHLVGTGPYSLQSFTPNSSVVLKRNPAYDWAPPARGVDPGSAGRRLQEPELRLQDAAGSVPGPRRFRDAHDDAGADQRPGRTRGHLVFGEPGVGHQAGRRRRVPDE